MTFTLMSQFHVYLPWVNVCLHSLLIVSFNQESGEGPSRSLLRDCKIFANLRITFVSSSSLHLHQAASARRQTRARPSAVTRMIDGVTHDKKLNCSQCQNKAQEECAPVCGLLLRAVPLRRTVAARRAGRSCAGPSRAETRQSGGERGRDRSGDMR